jgi:hypothetical protein
VDDRAVRKLAAAKDHEQRVAIAAADAVTRLEGKVKRIKRDLEAAVNAVEAARVEAREAEARAASAAAAYLEAVPEGDVVVGARTAAGKAV